jgi:hypothetical protein
MAPFWRENQLVQTKRKKGAQMRGYDSEMQTRVQGMVQLKD